MVGLCCVAGCKGLGACDGGKGGLFRFGGTGGEPTAGAADISPDNPHGAIRGADSRPAGAFEAFKMRLERRVFMG